MGRSVLLIAYHFPPLAGSSGIQRTLRFAQHLPAFGWMPLVLTADPRAYEQTADDLLAEVPGDLVVERAFALDTARHLAFKNRYPGFLARPDRWMSWRFDGVRKGLQMIRGHRPAAIWSTYPIATAHDIGYALHKKTGLPWIADFRDPMAQDDFPTDPKTWQNFKEIEERVLHNAAQSVFTTPGAAQMYRERYPDCAQRVAVIENGYDEESFRGSEAYLDEGPLNPGKITLLHSGIIYPYERDPRPFLDALAQRVAAGQISARDICVRLRASAHDDFLRAEIAQRKLEELVELAPPISYRQALNEMMRADVLLVLQASNCNAQIPAKLYEYLRARRPILGLTDPIGDTAGVLRQAGIKSLAPLDDVPAIGAAIMGLLTSIRQGMAPLATDAAIEAASRSGRTRDFAALLDRTLAA